MPIPVSKLPSLPASKPQGPTTKAPGVTLPKQPTQAGYQPSMKMGKMIDIGDGTFIEFFLPRRLRGRTDVESEQHPTRRRNSSLLFWDRSGDVLSMEIEFLAQASTDLEVRRPLNWLRSRAYPSYLGDLILRPPSTFSLICSGLVPLASLWEFSPGSLSWQTEGNLRYSSMMVPPKVTVNFDLTRVDETATRETVALG